MKKQTYITYLVAADGRKIDFERWGCKHAQTVTSNIRKLYGVEMRPWVRANVEKAVVVKCYATPDGCTEEGAPVWEIATADLLEAQDRYNAARHQEFLRLLERQEAARQGEIIPLF